MAELSEVTQQVQSFMDAETKSRAEISSRLFCLEQRATSPTFMGSGDDGDVGMKVATSDQYKSFANGNYGRSGRIEVGSFHTKTAIVNASGQNQPLVQAYRRPGIISAWPQRLTVRDVLPSFPTQANMIEFSRELSFTSAAAMQISEGTAKGESAATFELAYSPVQTLAHWIPASRQIMEDAQSLAAYLNQRMLYMLKLKEEDQLLNGTGSGTNLSGLITNAETYDLSYYNSGDTFLDVLAHALVQVEEGSNLEADAVILNPLDWHAIQLIKTGTTNEYIYSDPHSAQTPRVWGVPVVVTKSMARGQFLAGNFQMAAAIWDRNAATIELSREHDDFFVRNLVALLCEERLALTVFRSDALIYGGFPGGS